jgi:RsmE family RNA methyltransferase
MLETSAPCTIPDAIAGLPSDGWRHLASETATAVEETAPVPGSSSIVAVGPAAGFSAEEIRALEDGGFEPVRLAGTRLRTETAALAWAAWWARSALAHTPGAA